MGRSEEPEHPENGPGQRIPPKLHRKPPEKPKPSLFRLSLALVTSNSLAALSELVEHASPNQVKQLSSIIEIVPFEPSVRRFDGRSVISLFDGLLYDGSRLKERGLEAFERLGYSLIPYGKSAVAYTANSLPLEESLRDMPWLREVRPMGRMRLASSLGSYKAYSTAILHTNQVAGLPIVGIIDSGIDTAVPGLSQLVVHRESYIPSTSADLRHGTLNQSQGGMCICRGLGKGLDVSPESPGP